jgi:hypothetical protein
MIGKGSVALVLLVALLDGSALASGQTKNVESGLAPVAQSSAAGAAPGNPGTSGNPATDSSAANPACPDGNCEPSQPRITIATAASALQSWPWQERVAWGANIVLAILGYVGIMIALSTLRKIERQTRLSEEAAQAAAESAKVAMLHAQAMVRAERPWIVVTSEPSSQKENSFVVVATNRGRSPARILRSLDAMAKALDDSSLPGNPALARGKELNPVDGMILLPGESTGIRIFDRDEISNLAETGKEQKEIETGAIKVYLYGKITYRDLAEPDHADAHGTGWCLQYVQSRQNSALVAAGPAAYIRHT